MLHWIPYAFVRIVVFFIGGVLVALWYPGILPLRSAAMVFGALALLYFIFFFYGRSGRKLPFNPGGIGLMAVFLAGYCNLQVRTASRDAGHLLHVQENVLGYRAIITGCPEEKERSWKVEASLTGVCLGNGWRAVSGKMLLYFPKKEFTRPFQYGDVLVVRGKPEGVPPPSNPGEFDYRKFLSYRNIYHQQFLKQGDITWLENGPPNVVMKYAIDGRLRAEAVLERYVKGDRERGIASALVLGVTDGLDNTLLNAYGTTGVLHVLAVSGLHVGIIYWILQLFTRPLRQRKAGKALEAILCILVLWGYAFITGLSPSVLRAVAMFSFVAVARAADRHTNIYNILAASAFCLLVYDPFLLMSAGFQLSYLAVLGIVFFQPRFYASAEPQNRWVDEIWKVTCVSIAAQLVTFPLGLLYFHQFPNYFLLSNLFAIPLSSGALILGLVLIAVNFIQPLAHALGFLMEWIIRLLNSIIFSIDALPFSHTDGIHITPLQCWLLVGMILSFTLLMHYRRIAFLYTAGMLVVVFCGAAWLHHDQHTDQQQFIVYDVQGHTAMDLMDRGQVFFFADTALHSDAGKMKVKRHIQPGRLIAGTCVVRNGEELPVTEVAGGRIVVWKGKSFLQITGKEFHLPEKIAVDFVIISNNAIHDLSVLTRHIEAGEIILDSSNSYTFAGRLLKKTQPSSVKIHSVLHEGAFTKLI